MNLGSGESGPAGNAAFVTTHWSVVVAAQGSSPAAEEALEKLCRSYWRPLYGFVRRQGYPFEEAQDLTQGFFEVLLQRRDFESVRREKGRLRSYLLASLKHYLANDRRRAKAIKRGEGRLQVSLDQFQAEESAELRESQTLSADRIYDQRWALSVLEQVFQRLRVESCELANAALNERLTELLSDEPGRPSQADIAKEFGITENAVKQAFYRLRQRYRQLLCEEIAQTVANPADVEKELRELIAALRA